MARRKKILGIPQVNDLYKPVIQSLIDLGGSGTIEEINEKVYKISNYPDDIINILHGDDGRTEIEYRLAWARTVLKKYGLLENSSRGVWILTKKINPSDIDPDLVYRTVRNRLNREKNQINVEDKSEEESEIENGDWKDQLLEKLHNIQPSAFERLAQRLLRESGFIQVEVTGKTGDGGIDGKGIVRINGFLSFHVIFQCKRYKSNITPTMMRDFRGAMQGRAEKGLFITTGGFSREATKEATRDGVPPIDLIDGILLCDKLKELGLGIEKEVVEKIKINEDWFEQL